MSLTIATPSGGGNDYSTVETYLGQWVDGTHEVCRKLTAINKTFSSPSTLTGLEDLVPNDGDGISLIQEAFIIQIDKCVIQNNNATEDVTSKINLAGKDIYIPVTSEIQTTKLITTTVSNSSKAFQFSTANGTAYTHSQSIRIGIYEVKAGSITESHKKRSFTFYTKDDTSSGSQFIGHLHISQITVKYVLQKYIKY